MTFLAIWPEAMFAAFSFLESKGSCYEDRPHDIKPKTSYTKDLGSWERHGTRFDQIYKGVCFKNGDSEISKLRQ